MTWAGLFAEEAHYQDAARSEALFAWKPSTAYSKKEMLTYAPQTTTTQTWQPSYVYAPAPQYGYQLAIESPEAVLTTKKEDIAAAMPSVSVIPTLIPSPSQIDAGAEGNIIEDVTGILVIGAVALGGIYIASKVL